MNKKIKRCDKHGLYKGYCKACFNERIDNESAIYYAFFMVIASIIIAVVIELAQ